MAELLTRTRGGLIAIAILAIAAITGVTTMLRCPSGSGIFGACQAGASAAPQPMSIGVAKPVAVLRPVAAATLAPKAVANVAPVRSQEVLATEARGLVAGTFEMLEEADEAIVADAPQPAKPAPVLRQVASTGSAAGKPSGGSSGAALDVVRHPPLPTPDRDRVAAVEFPGTSPGSAALQEDSSALPEPTPSNPSMATSPDGAAGAPLVVDVGKGVLNVRSGPSEETRRLFALAPGQPVEATESDGSWVRIVADGNRAGWVDARYLKRAVVTSPIIPPPQAEGRQSTSKREQAAATSDVRIVGGMGVNVRSGPSRSNAVAFKLEGGKKATVSERSRGWVRIEDERGRSGWVYSTFLIKPKA